MPPETLPKHVLLTLELQPQEADLQSVKARLALDDREIDTDYGLVSISRRRNLYLMRVDPTAAERVEDSDVVRRISVDMVIEPA